MGWRMEAERFPRQRASGSPTSAAASLTPLLLPKCHCPQGPVCDFSSILEPRPLSRDNSRIPSSSLELPLQLTSWVFATRLCNGEETLPSPARASSGGFRGSDGPAGSQWAPLTAPSLSCPTSSQTFRPGVSSPVLSRSRLHVAAASPVQPVAHRPRGPFGSQALLGVVRSCQHRPQMAQSRLPCPHAPSPGSCPRAPKSCPS